MSSSLLLVAAYALVWAFVCGYLAWMVRRQERLRREVEALRGALMGQTKSDQRGGEGAR